MHYDLEDLIVTPIPPLTSSPEDTHLQSSNFKLCKKSKIRKLEEVLVREYPSE